MIILEAEQGSDEWHKARTGIPTASNFDQIITPQGARSKSMDKYIYTLAVERITGNKSEGYKSAAMERGQIVEGEARQFYEITKDANIVQIGFAYKDELKLFGASPDGLVGDDGGIELKCPLAHTHVGYLIEGKIPQEYIPQVQGQLFVTGRQWVDFISYYPGIKPLIVRVTRDEAFIAALELLLIEFCQKLDRIVKEILK